MSKNMKERLWLALCSSRVGKSNLEGVKDLIKEGADINCVFTGGSTVSMSAAMFHNSDFLKFVLAQKPDLNRADDMKNTALLYAIQNNNSDAVKLLVDAGAALNHANCRRHTALMEACLIGHLDMVTCLLDAGAQVNHTTKYHSPLSVADRRFVPRRFSTFHDKGYTELMLVAMKSPCSDLATSLLNAGSNVNAQTKLGQTTLTLASYPITEYNSSVYNSAQEDLVKVLLGAGANVNVVSGMGHTALMNAVRLPDNILTVCALMQAGARINCELHVAILFENNISIVNELISHGAVPTLQIPCKLWTHDPYFDEPPWTEPQPLILPSKTKTIALSPLAVAIYCGKVDIANYLVFLNFLNLFDLRMLPYHKTMKKLMQNSPYEETVRLYHIFSQPWSLFTVSFVMVSTLAGFGPDRASNLSKMGLPTSLQNKLMFRIPHDDEMISRVRQEAGQICNFMTLHVPYDSEADQATGVNDLP